MKAIISIFLAAWFGLGATFGPQFHCSCADGTETIEIGSQYCCDGGNLEQASSAVSCDGELCPHECCESVPVNNTSFVSSDRVEKEHIDQLVLADQPPLPTLLAEYILPSHCRQPHQIHECSATYLSRIHSVVLRV